MMKNLRQFYLTFLSIFFVTFLSTYITAQTKRSIRVVYQGENRSRLIAAYEKESIYYLPADVLADLMQIKYTINPVNQKMVLRMGSKSVKLTALNPFIMVDNSVYQMAVPTLYINQKIHVPLALFLDIVNDYSPVKMFFDPSNRVIRLQPTLYSITSVDFEKKGNGTLIHIHTTRPFQKGDLSLSTRNKWFYVTILGGSLDSLQIASEYYQGVVKKIIPYQFKKSVQISFLMDDKIVDKTVDVSENEIQISIWHTKKIESVLRASNAVDKKRWLINKIILDPGHGGRDPGTLGRSGTKEKDINLKIAKRLKSLLKKNLNVDVLMTREDDRYVKLQDRTTFANTNGGKLFVSIHCNANKKRVIRGYSTYILGVAKTKLALEVAEKENSVIAFEESAEVYKEMQDAAHILNAINQSSNLKESEDLARMINKSLGRKTKIPQCGKGVYQAGIYVLVGAAMPRVLVEVAFLSNTAEERYLRTRSFQQKIADALYESIRQFIQKYEQGIEG